MSRNSNIGTTRLVFSRVRVPARSVNRLDASRDISCEVTQSIPTVVPLPGVEATDARPPASAIRPRIEPW
jgi:hypothetical protein